MARGELPRVAPSHLAHLGSVSNYKKWLLIDDFLGDLFTMRAEDGEEHKYKPSIAIASLLFRIPDVEGINYPSVATNLKAINLCLKPGKADQYLIPSELVMMKFLDRAHPSTLGLEIDDPYLFKIAFIRKSAGISPDGEIRWGPEVDNLPLEEVQHLMVSP